MIVYFAISLLESLAISRLKKEHDSEIRAMREGEGRGKGKGKAGADGEDDGPGEKND
ncbi:hypothetical protein HK097_011142 [Rhizophlyctis rosea]|uniref:Uncharacterized protein n=1 Tax=Rhizophlyctis rosea TaxID=64517 RepID=A0AAD5X024_9FUNG|nr:hypothetical protein HK097_011142 [Rhizophlyctis rosea]